VETGDRPSFVYISIGERGNTYTHTCNAHSVGYGGGQTEEEINRFKKTLKTGGSCSPIIIEECSSSGGRGLLNSGSYRGQKPHVQI
jgi:hypothetical protein